MRHPFFPWARGGFSLVELLMVVSIIAVLASMLLPSLALVRAQAKAASCRNNLRQISACFYAYTNDNESQLPVGWKTASGTVIWDDLLSDYDGRDLPDGTAGSLLNTKTANYLQMTGVDSAQMRLYRMYVCPAETARYPGDPNATPVGEKNRFLRTYAMNRAWDGSTGAGDNSQIKGLYGLNATGTGADWSTSINAINNLGNVILLAEIRYIWGRLGGSLGAVIDNANSTGTGNSPGGMISQVQLSAGIGNRTPLHGTKWNYLFCDGHVETLQPAQTVSTGVALTAPVDAQSRWAR